jgi:hypothetical protein
LILKISVYRLILGWSWIQWYDFVQVEEYDCSWEIISTWLLYDLQALGRFQIDVEGLHWTSMSWCKGNPQCWVKIIFRMAW